MKHLQNNKGGAGILLFGLFSFLFVIVLMAALFQNYSILAAAGKVHSSMEKVALTAVARQTEKTYFSKRESWHGAYQTDGSNWQESIQFMDGVAQLNEMLHFQRDGSTLTKYREDGSLFYRLKDIVVLVDNPTLKQDRTIQATVSCIFEMPLRFGSIHRTISVPMSVTAENTPKF